MMYAWKRVQDFKCNCLPSIKYDFKCASNTTAVIVIDRQLYNYIYSQRYGKM